MCNINNLEASASDERNGASNPESQLSRVQRLNRRVLPHHVSTSNIDRVCFAILHMRIHHTNLFLPIIERSVQALVGHNRSTLAVTRDMMSYVDRNAVWSRYDLVHRRRNDLGVSLPGDCKRGGCTPWMCTCSDACNS